MHWHWVCSYFTENMTSQLLPSPYSRSVPGYSDFQITWLRRICWVNSIHWVAQSKQRSSVAWAGCSLQRAHCGRLGMLKFSSVWFLTPLTRTENWTDRRTARTRTELDQNRFHQFFQFCLVLEPVQTGELTEFFTKSNFINKNIWIIQPQCA